MKEAQAIRDAYQSVGSSLTVLQPCALSEADIATILQWRKSPSDPLVSLGLPIIVAEFKQAAVASIQERAMQMTSTSEYSLNRNSDPGSSGASGSFEDTLVRGFTNDMRLIDNILFGNAGSMSGEVQLGRYAEQRSPQLHADGSMPYVRTYIGRVIDLPIEVITGKKRSSTSDEEENLIVQASTIDYRQLIKHGSDPKIEDAKQQLRDHGVLTKLPLDKIALVGGGLEKDGTLHCSSPIPNAGAYSAFFRAVPEYS